MYVPEQIKNRITAKIAECKAVAEAHFKRTYRTPDIMYNVRGRKGGYAQSDRLINLNPILLMENVEEYVNQVVPHEFAHCVDAANGRDEQYMERAMNFFTPRRVKRSVHGPSWKAIMRLFGCEPDRCHQMDTSNAAVRTKTKYEYECVNCHKSYFVSSVRHNKQRAHAAINPGASFYTCNTCGRQHGKLKFIANRGQVSFQQARAASEQKRPVQFTADHIPAHMLPPKVKEQVIQKVQMGDNKALAFQIMQKYGFHLTRGQFIARAVDAGMKSTTASTYYAQLRRQ